MGRFMALAKGGFTITLYTDILARFTVRFERAFLALNMR
jgi:hypothetical protein